jgi:ADP-ribose diphosphatase
VRTIQPWRKTGSRLAGDFRIFTIRSDQKVSPRTREPHDFYIIDSVDWVNVIALTADERLVLVEQYRHGTESIELEIPGGMMDAGDSSPVRTALRELREETGYTGTPAHIIGKIFPNPAIMSNTCHTVLVQNCELRHTVEFDQSEDLVTRLVAVDEVPALVAGGRIRHALVAVALFHFELWRRRTARVAG